MKNNFTCLAIESSCDETAAAVVVDGRDVRSNVVLTQIDLHAFYGGVVPELACRAHSQGIVPVVDRALREAGTALNDLTAIAVTNAPGLVGALLIGVSAAKALALVSKKPLIPVDHIHGHMYACTMAFPDLPYPHISMIVSGGHTSLYACRSELDYRLLGATRDDAAGEAFDKVAKLLDLPFPGGPSIDRVSQGRDPTRYEFKRTLIDEDDFSFSGIKTAVLYLVRGQDAKSPRKLSADETADIAASFQEAMVDILLEKAFRACERHRLKTLTIGGGVACNSRLRAKGRAMAAERGVTVYFPPPEWCTDNAAMIGGLAFPLFRAGRTADLDLDAVPTKHYRK
jgi:N6-L-threonylcarbamoyladenine synthase